MVGAVPPAAPPPGAPPVPPVGVRFSIFILYTCCCVLAVVGKVTILPLLARVEIPVITTQYQMAARHVQLPKLCSMCSAYAIDPRWLESGVSVMWPSTATIALVVAPRADTIAAAAACCPALRALQSASVPAQLYHSKCSLTCCQCPSIPGPTQLAKVAVLYFIVLLLCCDVPAGDAAAATSATSSTRSSSSRWHATPATSTSCIACWTELVLVLLWELLQHPQQQQGLSSRCVRLRSPPLSDLISSRRACKYG
jgi:hypothetical protein